MAGGEPINVDAANATKVVVISYRDSTQQENNLDFTVDFIGSDDNDLLLEDGELAEFTVDVSDMDLPANRAFTLEVKPPTGSVIAINRTTPAALQAVMELR